MAMQAKDFWAMLDSNMGKFKTQEQRDRYRWLAGNRGDDESIARANEYLANVEKTGSGALEVQDMLNEQKLKQMTPEEIKFESVRGADNKLLDAYTYKPGTLDLGNIETFQKLRGRAMTEGPTQWAKLMQDQQRLEQAGLTDQAARQAMSGAAQARGSLAMRGGLSSGARERLAQGMGRSLLGARQDVARQGAMQRANILTQDEQQKLDLLKAVSGQEVSVAGKNLETQNQAQQWNLQQALEDQRRSQEFAQNQYAEKMKAMAAEREAQATEKSGGMCCFIMLESRYGDGTMDEVVRRYRDEKLTAKNKRGYYKLAEVLVPLMRKSKLVKALVKVTMADPLVSYGKWYYTGKGLGFVFKPVEKFWLGLFNYLGDEHVFIRENGEYV